jgi:PIH1 N-terminal domain
VSWQVQQQSQQAQAAPRVESTTNKCRDNLQVCICMHTDLRADCWTRAFCASCHRPQPGFVIKTTFTRNRNASSSSSKTETSSSTSSSSDSNPEKLFVNIVQSDKVGAPVREPVPPTAGDAAAVTGGCSLKLPHITGPLRMEKDNKAENTPSFDVCFHPEALSLCAQSDQAKVRTCSHTPSCSSKQ